MLQRHPTPSSLAMEHFGFSAPVDTDPATETDFHGLPCRSQHTPFGTYTTIRTGDCTAWTEPVRHAVTTGIAAMLCRIAPERDGCTLVCGIGNRALTADALGPLVCDSLSSALSPDRLCILSPDVTAKTGISTVSLIRAAAGICHAKRIIAVDALSAKSRETLGRVIQFSGDAITPGSGAGVGTEEISRRTMPCPVCTIGVPTVIRASVLCGTLSEKDALLVTDSGVDQIVKRYAQAIAGGILRYILER